MKLFIGSLLCLPLVAFAASPAFADRDEVRAFVVELHERDAFDSDELLKQFAQAKALPEVIELIKPPSEPGIRSWRTYRSRFVEPRRIAAGVKFWHAHGASLAKAEAKYGVPREIIVGIIGVETIYGKTTGRFQTFSALTTLAFDYPPRAELFRKELESLLLLAREENRDVLSYRGSYAGALGLPQFMPSSVRQWAVDFDGDGKVNLTKSANDAIGSVARFLAEHGWQSNGPTLVNATVEGPLSDELLAEGIRPKHAPAELVEFGVTATDAPALPCALIDYVTPDAPTTYRLGYNNFFVLTRYNRSSFYATAVIELAEAIKAQIN